MLADSVLAGVGAFLFSTFAITVFGEILPQSYFSRHALRTASTFAPFLRFYGALLFFVTRPTAWILDRWLGPEAAIYWPERSFRELIKRHILAEEADLSNVEGMGALNFLTLDDLPLSALGEVVDERSIVTLPREGEHLVSSRLRCLAPRPVPTEHLRLRQEVGHSFAGPEGRPRWVLNASSFLSAALFADHRIDPMAYCHRPIVVRNAGTLLGEVISRFEVRPEHPRDYVIDHDVILVWAAQRRVITGADLLGRLLHGVVLHEPWTPPATA